MTSAENEWQKLELPMENPSPEGKMPKKLKEHV